LSTNYAGRALQFTEKAEEEIKLWGKKDTVQQVSIIFQ
jgi:hypothetical protein